MKASIPSPSRLPRGSRPDPSFPSREPRTSAAAGRPFFLELRFLSALCLASGVAVCDTVVALPLHWHPQLSADQLGHWGHGTRYIAELGGHQSAHPSWGLGTSRVRGAKLIRAMYSGGRSEQRCGEEGQAGQGQGGGSSPVRQSCKSLTTQPLSVLCSQQLHKRLCHHAVLRSAVCPLEWSAHGPAEAEVPEGGEKDR